MDAIYYRPESNTEYIWGICMAFLYAFGGFALISSFMAMTIHLFASVTPFNIGIYLFYLFTMIIPSTIFTLGLSFWSISWIRNQALTQLVLLGYFLITIIYVKDYQQGLFDPLGITLPNTFSDFTGHPDIVNYLAQRGSWLFVGLGLIQAAIMNFERIPNRPGRIKKTLVMISLFTSGILLGFSFFHSNHSTSTLRQVYKETYNKYAFAPKATLVSQNITYDQKGNRIAVHSDLLIQNQTKDKLEEIILYLNPKLNIVSLTSSKVDLHFERDNQVILIRQSLLPGDSLKIHIGYEGKVDENICYLDVPDEIFTNTENRTILACRFGKRSVFLEKDFTLLIPEVLWYPTTVSPVTPQCPYYLPKNFTYYTLQVTPQGKSRVISQGKKSTSAAGITFKNDLPLTGISLCIGDYTTRQIIVDSTLYELNMLKEHAHLLNNIGKIKDLSVSELIKKLKSQAESETGKSYPFDRFILTETPIHYNSCFRNERGGSEFVQPELMFFPELGINTLIKLPVKSEAFIREELKNILLKEKNTIYTFSWESLLGFGALLRGDPFMHNIKDESNHYQLSALFFNQSNFIYSNNYYFINVLLNLIIQDNNTTRKDGRIEIAPRIEPQAINYLTTKSLKEALADENLQPVVLNAILILKSRELTDYFNTKGIPLNSLVSFILFFSEKHQFEQVDFSCFEREFESEFHTDWHHILPEWYARKQIPQYLIKDLSAHRIVDPDKNRSRMRLEFSIFNDSKTDGIINIQTLSELPGGPEARKAAWKDDRREFVIDYLTYKIEAGTGKNIALILDNLRTATLNTNISHNKPNQLALLGLSTSDTSQYTRMVTKDYFLPDSNEVIVDNEESGCKIIQSSFGLKWSEKWKKSETNSHDNYVRLGAVFPTDKWKTYFSPYGYGLTTRSYLFKKATSDKYSLEWSAQLHRAGRYEAFVYIPGRLPLSKQNWQQKYKISPCGEDEKIVIIDNIHLQSGWVSLGYFNCQSGESKIYLSDEGTGNQILIGDAVKWVYLSKQ